MILQTEQELLDAYKKYDYLNQDKAHPLVKILVSYIKPAFLFKSEILTPIQLGKAVEYKESKDGAQSEENLKWLHENCALNDDFEEGISNNNRRIGFFTGTYWAWKNYEKLGNPSYFGSFGYRRLFDATTLTNLPNVDMIIPEARIIEKIYQDRLIDYLGTTFFNQVMQIICNKYPNEIDPIQEYLNQNKIYFDELYIMKKDLFFQFCEWIFPILQDLIKLPKDTSIDYGKFTTKELLQAKNESRDLAYVMEFLTGYFLAYQKKKTHYLEANTILLYKDNQINMFDVLRKRVLNATTG